ncbi:MAG: hypothetical protein JO369_02565 [Paucibacter sp.]|nr:hypothetical protein [Roseateles sp.]MBV8379635.1 hypothetical protein [Roseateles sp.]
MMMSKPLLFAAAATAAFTLLQAPVQASAPTAITQATAQATARSFTPVQLNCGKNAVAATVSEYSNSGGKVHVVMRSAGASRPTVDETLATAVAQKKYASIHPGSVVCVANH